MRVLQSPSNIARNTLPIAQFQFNLTNMKRATRQYQMTTRALSAADTTHRILVSTAEDFWNSPTPFNRATNSGYIVTRLEGWTTNSIKAMIDRSVEAAYLVGTWVFDISPEYGFYLSHAHPWGVLEKDYTGLRYLDFNRLTRGVRPI